jgi:hypothetical protein
MKKIMRDNRRTFYFNVNDLAKVLEGINNVADHIAVVVGNFVNESEVWRVEFTMNNTQYETLIDYLNAAKVEYKTAYKKEEKVTES